MSFFFRLISRRWFGQMPSREVPSLFETGKDLSITDWSSVFPPVSSFFHSPFKNQFGLVSTVLWNMFLSNENVTFTVLFAV